MRASIIYSVFILAILSFTVFLLVKHEGKVYYVLGEDEDAKRIIKTYPSLGKENVAKHDIDIGQIITSQPYYDKLCKLDRYDFYQSTY